MVCLSRIRVSQNKSIYDLTIEGRTLESLLSIPEVLNHPLIRDIKNAEVQANQQISELSQVFGPRHQRMIAVQAELDTILATLADEVRKLVNGIQTEYRSAVSNQESTERKLNNAKNDFQRLSSLERVPKVGKYGSCDERA